MIAVILAGGLGTRISEETHLKPKPMIEIGGKPILWHIMKIYSAHGVDDFVICCGYKGYVIKEYFANYFLHMSDVTFDMAKNQMQVHRQLGGALARHARRHRRGHHDRRTAEARGATMCARRTASASPTATASAIFDIEASIAFHRRHGKLATVTAVQPPGRYGAIELSGDSVSAFVEKPRGDGGLISGGFFVLSPQCIELIEGDATPWEAAPMNKLAAMGQLMAFEHRGFWQPMDTLREKNLLEDLWASGKAPWKQWS